MKLSSPIVRASLIAAIATPLLLGTSVGRTAGAEPARIDVYPPNVQLDNSRDRQRVIVVATRGDGVTEDVTAKAKLTLADPKLAKLDKNTVAPAADGQTTLAVEYGGKTASIPVVVKSAATAPPVSFKLDVMPVLTRAGCNTGGCHGSARGKDGFHLSLFGYDPDGDHFRLSREVPFRRINLAVPEESLLLQKAAGSVPHTGGKRFETTSQYYATILAWLQAGAPSDSGKVPTVENVELYPPQAVLEGEGNTQSMLARAKYSDGTDRDVTDLAVFLSNNDNSAAVDASGLVNASKRGEAFVLARYDTKTVGSQFIVLPAGIQGAPPSTPPANYIDELVNAKLQKLRIQPSELCSDQVFLRRVTIDITGRLPSEDDYRSFIADKDPAKRAKLVDRLLGQKEFAEIWAMKWAELLMIKSSNTVSYKSTYLYYNWLSERISRGVPLDQIVRDVLTASGGTFSNPATNFYQIETDTLKTAENVAQVFLGLRVQCAQCHNHPFDRWTMDDYYGFAGFFSQIGRKTAEDYRETVVFNRGGGEVRHPVTGRPVPPTLLGGPQPDVKGKDRREIMAAWLTSPDNPYFAASVANRIWAHFFGIGIVEPVDDVRVSNPPSNPQLLDALGKKLVEYKYDFRRLVRDLCNSQTYQRSTQANATNADDERNFARARVRRIQAEMLLDCVSQVTETKDKFRGLPLGARAVEIADGTTTNYFLTTFGRSPRETVCACEVQMSPTLSQALHQLNGDTINGKVRAGGVVKKMLDARRSPEEIIKTLYLRCLGREPSPEELAKLNTLAAGGQTVQRLEDVFWGILNSREFSFNH